MRAYLRLSAPLNPLNPLRVCAPSNRLARTARAKIAIMANGSKYLARVQGETEK